MTTGETIHQRLLRAADLDTWEPLDGHAIVTCKILIRSGAYEAWEPRTYEFHRTEDGGWIIHTNPGYLQREDWQRLVEWFCQMAPIQIDLLTTV